MKGTFRKRGCNCTGKRCTCDATWSFRIDIGVDPQTGKRKQKEFYGFATKKEAEAACAEMITQIERGTFVSEKNILFKDFAEQWIEMYAASGRVRNSTVDVRRTKLKILLDYFANLKLKSVTKLIYEEMLNDLKKRGYARKTISSVNETGKLLFKKALEKEIIKSNPTQFAEVPIFRKTVEELETETELPKYLEKEELAMFLKTAKEQGKSDDYPIFLLLAYTGLRVGELCVLKWKDIDFENHTVNVNKTLYTKTGIETYELNPPKTKKSKRVIDVDPAVFVELEAHKARQNVTKMKFRKTYHNNDFVFAMDYKLPGYPRQQMYIEKRMKILLKAAGLNQTLTPHSLRHTHTSLLAEAEVKLETIMDRLGHTDDTTTREIYLHVTKPRKKEASQKFSELMRSV